jgi:type IV secretion system protein VirB4
MSKPPRSPTSNASRARLDRRERGAHTMLPYARHATDTMLTGRDGSAMQIIHVAGFPFETADTDDLNYRKNVRDTVLRGIASSRLAVYHHVIRRQVETVVEGRFNTPFARGLDHAWKKRLGSRRLFVNDLFISLVRRPTLADQNPLDGLLGRNPHADATARAASRSRRSRARAVAL